MRRQIVIAFQLRRPMFLAAAVASLVGWGALQVPPSADVIFEQALGYPPPKGVRGLERLGWARRGVSKDVTLLRFTADDATIAMLSTLGLHDVRDTWEQERLQDPSRAFLGNAYEDLAGSLPNPDFRPPDFVFQGRGGSNTGVSFVRLGWSPHSREALLLIERG